MVFYTGDGNHVSKSLCVEISLSSLPMPLTWIESESNESDAAGQFFISEGLQKGS
jgi:hypothetical protein